MSDTLPEPEPNYRAAFNHLSDALLNEALDRDWCDEYDTFVQGVNTRLPHGIEIPERSRTFRVNFDCEISAVAVSDLESAIDQMLRTTFNADSCTDFNYEIA